MSLRPATNYNNDPNTPPPDSVNVKPSFESEGWTTADDSGWRYAASYGRWHKQYRFEFSQTGPLVSKTVTFTCPGTTRIMLAGATFDPYPPYGESGVEVTSTFGPLDASGLPQTYTYTWKRPNAPANSVYKLVAHSGCGLDPPGPVTNNDD